MPHEHHNVILIMAITTENRRS